MSVCVMLIALVSAPPDADIDVTVLDHVEMATEPSAVLTNYFQSLAHDAAAARRERFEQLETEEQCQAYQQRIRDFFLRQIGGFPERTPLNAQVVGTLEGEDYRVEKVIYESRPHHHVTAALYLPNAAPPYPGVLIACGHSKTGKGADYNQRMGILLAKNGMAALCYDPIGQGERSQILDDQGEPKYGSTTEHTMVGVGAILLGINTAQYRIWDGIRGIDYLISRDDIDPKKIGCTGCSGGGTLTSYIMTLDERVACAAPACYLTTFERLLDTIGPQDAEQNIFGQVAFGMDQTDYVLSRAPKPTLMCATTEDFFDIDGTWDNFRQAKRFYTRLGYPERVDLVEDDSRHGVTQTNREALTHWMCRWLLGKDRPVTESDFPLWTVQQLHCTPDGEVLLLPGEKSVFDLNAERAERLVRERRPAWQAMSDDERRAAVRKLAGVRPLGELPPIRSSKIGTQLFSGWRLEKFVLEPEPGLMIPALIGIPQKPNGEAYLYAAELGKASLAEPGGVLERTVRDGHVVMLIDLPGLGETQAERRGQTSELFGDWKNTFFAYLLGKSIVGLHAENLLASAQWLVRFETDSPRRLHAVASGQCTIPMLHAAATAPGMFYTVRLKQSIKSWHEVIAEPEMKNQLVNTIHGVLAVYDIPDLVRLIGEDRVVIED